MGRDKSKRKAKLKQKRISKSKNGKPVYFTLANSGKKYPGFSNKYSYKTNVHNLVYKDAKIENVNFRASIVTECNFRNAQLKGIDFIYTNLKGCDFRNTKFNNVIFFASKLEDANFEFAEFHNTFFISTNTDNSKNLDLSSPGLNVLDKYPEIQLNKKTLYFLEILGNVDEIYKYHVLHVSKKKINNWIIDILISFYGEKDLSRSLYALYNRRNKKLFYTFYSFNKFMSDYLKNSNKI